MNIFTLRLFAVGRGEVIDGVVSFRGEDASGGFGILAHHDRFMTALSFGLARLRFQDGRMEYLALPGGVLYFVDNELRISTRRYLRDTDATRIAAALDRDLLQEERVVEQARRKLRRLEAEMLRRVAHLGTG